MAPLEDYGETNKLGKKSQFSPNKSIVLPRIAPQGGETKLKYEISPKS